MHISIPGNWASNNPVFAISHGPCAAAPSTPSQCSALPRHAVVPSRFPVQVRQAAQGRPPSEPLLSVRVIQRRVRRRNFPLCRALPGSEYYGGSAPPGPFSGRRAYPGTGPDARHREPRPGGSRVHHHSLGEGGARLYPGGLATGTPQTFPVASRACSGTLPGSSRRNGKRRDAPRPAQIRQIRAGVKVKDVTAPVPRVLLSATLAGPVPSGSTETSRLCQGCSRPPRHHPDQAALSYTALLRQDSGEGLSPPLE